MLEKFRLECCLSFLFTIKCLTSSSVVFPVIKPSLSNWMSLHVSTVIGSMISVLTILFVQPRHGDEIAIFQIVWRNPSKMQFFQREEDIYNTCMLNNNHILRFIASDSHFRGNGKLLTECMRVIVIHCFLHTVSTEPILLFEYIPNGNLTENLRRGLLNTDVVLKLCLSLLSGLQFLHHEMLTVGKRKPG